MKRATNSNHAGDSVLVRRDLRSRGPRAIRQVDWLRSSGKVGSTCRSSLTRKTRHERRRRADRAAVLRASATIAGPESGRGGGTRGLLSADDHACSKTVVASRVGVCCDDCSSATGSHGARTQGGGPELVGKIAGARRACVACAGLACQEARAHRVLASVRLRPVRAGTRDLLRGSRRIVRPQHVHHGERDPAASSAPRWSWRTTRRWRRSCTASSRSSFPTTRSSTSSRYYDYYQPEAYVPSSDTYIEKDASINEHIEQMRLSATKALLERLGRDHRRDRVGYLRSRRSGGVPRHDPAPGPRRAHGSAPAAATPRRHAVHAQ